LTQVDLYDNLWKAQSSFVTEMIGLKKIMTISDSSTLVLSDELTKGTEIVSATSIFTAVVLELVRRNTKFVFTTHLQDVAKIQDVKENKHIEICHLSVLVKDEDIIFERKLQKGPCSELYGLEVAKAIGIDSKLMDSAFDIRNKLLNKKTGANAILENKRSRYNRKKILDSCEICAYTPSKSTDIPLDTHHIEFQCSADKNNFNGHFHKNSTFNLVCLCKSCHIDVHNEKITINGYIQSTNGVKLEYTKL